MADTAVQDGTAVSEKCLLFVSSSSSYNTNLNIL